MSRQDLILATIRTAVPAGLGWLLAWAIAQIPAIADWIATADLLLAQSAPGTTIAVLLNAAAIAATVALYYWVARRLGAKWPALERWLLGSSVTPTYAPVVVYTEADPLEQLGDGGASREIPISDLDDEPKHRA